MLIRSIFALLASVIFSSTVFTVDAQEVIRHPARPTANKFVKHKSTVSDTELEKMLKAARSEKSQSIDPTEKYKEYLGVFKFDNLPICSVSQTRKESLTAVPMAQVSPIDFIFYSTEVSGDAARAKQFPELAIPYKAGKVSASDKDLDIRAGWVKVLQVKCLPTRVYLENKPDGASVIYAEGEYAWTRPAE